MNRIHHIVLSLIKDTKTNLYINTHNISKFEYQINNTIEVEFKLDLKDYHILENTVFFILEEVSGSPLNMIIWFKDKTLKPVKYTGKIMSMKHSDFDEYSHPNSKLWISFTFQSNKNL